MQRCHHASLVILAMALFPIETVSLLADDGVPGSVTGTATSHQDTEGLAAVRKFLATEDRWTRLYTYDGQVTVGSAVRSGNVVSRGRKLAAEPMKYVLFEPASFSGSAVLWIDGAGSSHLCEPGRKPDDVQPTPSVRSLLNSGFAVTSVDIPSMPGRPAIEIRAETSLLSQRVRATLAAVTAVMPHVQQLDIVGTGDAGPAVLLASAFLNDLNATERNRIRYLIADLRGVTAEMTAKSENVFFLPGAEKFGGVPGIAALDGTQKMMVAGTQSIPAAELQVLQDSYQVSGKTDSLKLIMGPLSDELVVELVSGE